MSDTLAPGLTATRRVEVDAKRTISFMGDDCRVYSTPNLLYDIEMTCRDLLLEHIDAGKDSVGTRVELDHLGATLLGMWVEITVTLAEVNGGAVAFAENETQGAFAAYKLAVILEGIHYRFQQGGTVGDGFDHMAPLVSSLAERALEVADDSALTALHA